jgi:large subunit ribosomal protein L10
MKRRRSVDRLQKKKMVASLHEVFSESDLVVVAHQVGLTVAESTELRRQMGEAGARFRVTKNRLTRLALKGTPHEGLAPLFKGPTAVAVSRDPVAAARVAVKFAKDNDKLTIVGGGLGEQVLDIDGVKALASLPSLDELRARIVGLIQAPATKIAGVLQAPASQVARVIGAHASQDEAQDAAG